ncbi:MAG: FecR family protein [Thermodesulfobacteriota bacterium]
MKRFRMTLVALLVLLSCGFTGPYISGALARDAAKDLPEELRRVQLGERPTRSDTPEVGVVTSVTGRARMVILHKKQNAGHYGMAKDPLFEEDAVYSLRDSRCRLEFRDKSVAMLAPESRLDIGEVALSMLKGEKRASFELLKGKAIFYALPLFGYREMKLQVNTPSAMIGVRGTKFGVQVVGGTEERSESGPVRLAGFGLFLAQGTQTRNDSLTRIYVFEGAVEVTSLVDGKKLTLRENEIVDVDRRGLGEVRVDLEKIKAFLEDVAGETGSVTEPGRDRQIMEQRYRREEMDRFDQLQDIKQREITPPVSPHSGPSR